MGIQLHLGSTGLVLALVVAACTHSKEQIPMREPPPAQVWPPGALFVLTGHGVCSVLATGLLEDVRSSASTNDCALTPPPGEKPLQPGDPVIAFRYLAMNATGVIHVASPRIRALVSADQVDALLSRLKQTPTAAVQAPWGELYPELMRARLSPNPADPVDAFGLLCARTRGRPPTFGEKKVLDELKNLLVDEFHRSKGVPPDTMTSSLESACG